jgi:hypothetical protein
MVADACQLRGNIEDAQYNHEAMLAAVCLLGQAEDAVHSAESATDISSPWAAPLGNPQAKTIPA